MINTFRRYLRKIQIKVAHIRSKFDVVMQNKIPHIKINEKHEKNVKIILRLLTVVGIASSRTILFEHITVCKRSELDKEKNVFEYYNVPQY